MKSHPKKTEVGVPKPQGGPNLGGPGKISGQLVSGRLGLVAGRRKRLTSSRKKHIRWCLHIDVLKTQNGKGNALDRQNGRVNLFSAATKRSKRKGSREKKGRGVPRGTMSSSRGGEVN